MSIFKSLKAEAAIAAFLILKPGSADDTAVKAAGPTDLLLGTADSLATPAADMVDLDLRPESEVVLGGAVSLGQAITSDANGKGVYANPAAGVKHRIIGFAMQGGAANDVIRYLRAPGQITG